MAFDVTDPYAPTIAGYVNRPDFSVVVNLAQNPAAAGDLDPEGIAFISAADSPSDEAMIAVANEISGTMTLFRIRRFCFVMGSSCSETSRRAPISGERLFSQAAASKNFDAPATRSCTFFDQAHKRLIERGEPGPAPKLTIRKSPDTVIL